VTQWEASVQGKNGEIKLSRDVKVGVIEHCRTREQKIHDYNRNTVLGFSFFENYFLNKFYQVKIMKKGCD
jgi:hypothetical protein